jgi:ferric-dicitrate binding protein FerR (iron transport regulator)
MVIVMSSQKAPRHHPSRHRAPRRKKLWLKISLLALFAIALIGIAAWFACVQSAKQSQIK